MCVRHVHTKDDRVEHLRIVEGDEGGAELTNLGQNSALPVFGAIEIKHFHYTNASFVLFIYGVFLLKKY